MMPDWLDGLFILLTLILVILSIVGLFLSKDQGSWAITLSICLFSLVQLGKDQ